MAFVEKIKEFALHNLLDIGNAAAWIGLFSIFYLDQFKLFEHKDELRILTSLFIAAAGVSALYFNYKRNNKNCYSSCYNEDQINKKMLNIVNEYGNTCILSRNISWASYSGVHDALLEKAMSGDLKIYYKDKNNSLNLFSDPAFCGDVLCCYGHLDFSPQCRFTFKKMGSKDEILYIAHSHNDVHKIYKYNNKDGPIFYLAKDVIDILRSKCDK